MGCKWENMLKIGGKYKGKYKGKVGETWGGVPDFKG